MNHLHTPNKLSTDKFLNEVLTIKIWWNGITILSLYSKLNTMSQSFCYGMMVTQLVLFGIFMSGIVYIVGHEIFRMIKK